MLRNPIDRVISNYYFILEQPEHYLHKEVVSKTMDLKTFVLSGVSTEQDNGQTRRIAGVSIGRLQGRKQVDHGCCTTEILESAKKNLESNFSIIGLTERFDETLFLLKKAYNWSLPLYYHRGNKTKRRPKMKEIPKDTINAIRDFNKFDLELYEWAKVLFERQLEQFEISKQQLANFQKLNKYYQKSPLFSSSVQRIRVLRQRGYIKTIKMAATKYL
ncbi:MAG: sulfotransferase family 2 domain-containing protein [Anaerolineae bacterium]|nr:sulfotransferase family 2 domain-containing protein [Anaerolineae bacterium]